MSATDLDLRRQGQEDILSNLTPTAREYPVVRYMGSKYRLLDWIAEETSHLDFESVLDGFSGSGAVSYLFKTLNKTVYSNDFLHFSYILSRATVENQKQTISTKDLNMLCTESDCAPQFILDTFSGIFFSESDLQFLDTVSFNLSKLANKSKVALAKAALIRSCLKKQPRGVFTISGDTKKYDDGRRDLRLTISEHFREQIDIYNGIVFETSKKHKSFHGDIFDFNNSKYRPDLVYLDPPYVPRSDDNCYVKRYHFVEGLSKYWENESIDYNTKVRKIEKKYTPFSYKRTALDAFDRLFSKFSDSVILLSYSSNGYPDLPILVDLLGKYKGEVLVKEKNHKYHFGTHKAVKRSQVVEYLILGK